MTTEELAKARELHNRQWPDSEDHERFFSWYGGKLLDIAEALHGEEMREKIARELAWQLGDTMGDARGVFISSEMHQNGDRWRKAASAIMALIGGGE